MNKLPEKIQSKLDSLDDEQKDMLLRAYIKKDIKHIRERATLEFIITASSLYKTKEEK
jgi:hypothetical protein